MVSSPFSQPQSATASHPTHLDPSELGTKEYWETYYDQEIHEHNNYEVTQAEPEDIPSWFDDVDAPAKIIAFLTSDNFPLSAAYEARNGSTTTSATTSDAQGTAVSEVIRTDGTTTLQVSPASSVLDLGTGNGSLLFQLRQHDSYPYLGGLMMGIDYSPKSITLARSLRDAYVAENRTECADIQFEAMDLIRDEPEDMEWWPRKSTSEISNDGSEIDGFDLVLDKGTFDAISLSDETLPGSRLRICETYPSKVSKMVKLGGFLLITSCNWTEDEVVRWFTTGKDVVEQLEVWGKVEYPKFKFGGQEGQGVASICFRRVK